MPKKKNTTVTPPEAEWSHLLDVENVGDELLTMNIFPDKDEIQAVSERLGILDIEKCDVNLTISRQNRGLMVHVDGKINADVVQQCIKTLEPVASHIDETFEAWFADPEAAISFAKEQRRRKGRKSTDLPILEESEDPEAIVDGQIDLGELSVQYLSLFLDPYPQSPNAEKVFTEEQKREKIPNIRKNPFAALKEWKDRNN